MKFALATVIFPEIIPFFHDFIQSLKSQTDQGFQLLIINDGCNLSDLNFHHFDPIIITSGFSITRNRELLIKEADRLNYEWIVFADADDWFEDNRIEIIRHLTSEYDLIANEIIPFSNGKYADQKFETVLGEFQQIDLNFIRDKNLFGLSNSACRIQYLKGVEIPKEIIAVDWFIFSKALQAGAKACFTSQTKTYYRQWDKNTIGMDKISDNEITTGVKAKYYHYKYMSLSDTEYLENINWLHKLYSNIQNQRFNCYINSVRRAGSTTFWWENIKNYNHDENSIIG